MNSVLPFILASTALYGFTLAIAVLAHRSYMKGANTALSALVFIFSVFLLFNAIQYAEIAPMAQRLSLLVGALWFLIYPLIFLHATFLTEQKYRYQPWINVLHFLPFVTQMLYIFPFYMNYSIAEQMDWMQGGETQQTWKESGNRILYFIFSKGVIFFIQISAYLPLSLILIHRYIKKCQYKLSNAGRNQLTFFKYGYFALACITLIMEVLVMIKLPGNWFLFVLMSFSVVIFILAYLSMTNPHLLYKKVPFKWTYRSRALPSDEIAIYATLLNEQLEHQVYADPDLTVDRLAKKINLQPRQLAGLLKTHYQKSFSEFINQKRVEAAQRLLRNKEFQHWSILAIGLEVGFKSKSTFNRAFKKTVGQTPSDYMNSNPDLVDINESTS